MGKQMTLSFPDCCTMPRPPPVPGRPRGSRRLLVLPSPQANVLKRLAGGRAGVGPADAAGAANVPGPHQGRAVRGVAPGARGAVRQRRPRRRPAVLARLPPRAPGTPSARPSAMRNRLDPAAGCQYAMCCNWRRPGRCALLVWWRCFGLSMSHAVLCLKADARDSCRAAKPSSNGCFKAGIMATAHPGAWSTVGQRSGVCCRRRCGARTRAA